MNKKITIIIIIFTIFLHDSNFFKNIYDIGFRPYYHRLVRYYGDCEKQGYGFAWAIHNKEFPAINENIRILNFANYGSIDSLFYVNNRKTSDKYFILINFDENNASHINKLKNFPYSIKQVVRISEDFQIVKKKLSCYLIKKN